VRNEIADAFLQGQALAPGVVGPRELSGLAEGRGSQRRRSEKHCGGAMKPSRLGWLLALSISLLYGQVSFDRIVSANKEPQNWLTYSGTVLSQRHSLLTQITPANVRNLQLQWIFQAQSLEKFEATPLVVDGVLYTVQAPNDVVAIDAETGRVFWVSPYTPSPEARTCCGR